MTRRRALTVTALVAAATLAGSSLAVASGWHQDRSGEVRRAIDAGTAKNVIMFLGDGMGDSEITIARNYAVGAAGRLNMDSFPLTGAYTTYAVQKGTASTPDYVTDSAASGTGWATGHKTYNNAVSVDPVTFKPMTTILEKA
jgi:alkaline phosphatase